MIRNFWREAFVTYKSPACLALLLLGFAAGLPTMLVFSTLSVWLREAGVSRETIGYASWIGLAYAFKWVWSPMLDQWRLPIIGTLGRRRSWLVFSQVLVGVGLLGMAFCNPQFHLSALIALAVMVAFASATQDIAIDAYRLEIAEDSRQAALAACYMTGYRVASLLASAGALFLADLLGSSVLSYSQSAWATTYMLFALLVLPGLLTSLLISEPPLAAPMGLADSRFGFNHQLLSVALVLVMLISVPAMINALIDRAWPRALLYALFIIGCLSPWGRRIYAPIRDLFEQIRHPFALQAAASKVDEVPRFDFAHQAVSVIVLIILCIAVTGGCQSFYGGYWPRGLMYLLIALLCLSTPGRRLMGPVLTPVSEFVQRYRWQALMLLGLISTYRLSDTVMGVMAGVFYIDIGYSKDVIASVSKIFGVIMTLLGAAAGGILTARIRILPILLIGGIASALTNLLFALIAMTGASLPLLVITICFDNFSAGLASSAFIAYLSSLTNLRFSATQYALLSSLMLLLPRLLGGYSGTLVEQVGYVSFFTITALLGIPTLLLIMIMWIRQAREPAPEAVHGEPRTS
ncbi:PAT family beta-lactamase induction signal transducer AmpG [Pseudomonas duriflava]|uniref:PAT family beta-lactamase induction signal transducer AmpG n=1 Tax=Pseudomonas duriflava TaxID=459528 RepID=A0A562QP97_9PSED|nr:AmpG family muropeptide MFS transporter [Pseudomonas duriflava]TWI58493.1 PAT family beta-lactamase induction signal transducer AmpG [Pseudomonas duriflava]